MELRLARFDEADLINELALRSKAHWGYDADFLEASRRVMYLSGHHVLAYRTAVAEVDGRVVGFYTLAGEPPTGELGHLFVDPPYIGQGVGRALWSHAVEASIRLGFERFTLDSDPHAEAFYLAMGAKRTGEAPSVAIAGRMLPRLTYGTLEG